MRIKPKPRDARNEYKRESRYLQEVCVQVFLNNVETSVFRSRSPAASFVWTLSNLSEDPLAIGRVNVWTFAKKMSDKTVEPTFWKLTMYKTLKSVEAMVNSPAHRIACRLHKSAQVTNLAQGTYCVGTGCCCLLTLLHGQRIRQRAD